MGVLYAKVSGSWVPILNSTGPAPPNWPDGYPTYDPRYVNVTGDTMTGKLIASGSNNPFSLIGNGAGAAWIGFEPTTAGTREGYVGVNSGWLRLQAEAGNGAYMVSGVDKETRIVSLGTAGFVALYANNFELMRVMANPQAVLMFTTDPAAANNNPGLIFSASNWLHIANAGLNTPNFVANKVGAGIGSGSDFVHFRTNNNTIGSITRNAQQAAVLYNTTSDYRLKEDRGRIIGARERISVLKPRRVVWKEDPTRAEVDGFFAHEVAEAVPDAVTGEKDGEAMQQLDATRLIPLLTAALQEAHDRIDVLEARINALEAA